MRVEYRIEPSVQRARIVVHRRVGRAPLTLDASRRCSGDVVRSGGRDGVRGSCITFRAARGAASSLAAVHPGDGQPDGQTSTAGHEVVGRSWRSERRLGAVPRRDLTPTSTSQAASPRRHRGAFDVHNRSRSGQASDARRKTSRAGRSGSSRPRARTSGRRSSTSARDARMSSPGYSSSPCKAAPLRRRRVRRACRLQVVAQPLHGLCSPLHLLLRPGLRGARRPPVRRPLRTVDPRQVERRRGAARGARPEVVGTGGGCSRNRDRPVPAGGRKIPADARVPRRARLELDSLLDRHTRAARRP